MTPLRPWRFAIALLGSFVWAAFFLRSPEAISRHFHYLGLSSLVGLNVFIFPLLLGSLDFALIRRSSEPDGPLPKERGRGAWIAFNYILYFVVFLVTLPLARLIYDLLDWQPSILAAGRRIIVLFLCGFLVGLLLKSVALWLATSRTHHFFRLLPAAASMQAIHALLLIPLYFALFFMTILPASPTKARQILADLNVQIFCVQPDGSIARINPATAHTEQLAAPGGEPPIRLIPIPAGMTLEDNGWDPRVSPKRWDFWCIRDNGQKEQFLAGEDCLAGPIVLGSDADLFVFSLLDRDPHQASWLRAPDRPRQIKETRIEDKPRAAGRDPSRVVVHWNSKPSRVYGFDNPAMSLLTSNATIVDEKYIVCQLSSGEIVAIELATGATVVITHGHHPLCIRSSH